MTEAILIRQDGAVRTITLNRPEKHNAFDDAVIADLTAAFEAAGTDASVRVVVLAASGKHFCAGADLGWMRRMAEFGAAENRRDAEALAQLLHTIDRCPKPVLGLVQGNAYGGGVGLVAACDIVLVVETARFALSEVRLGLVPATIAPYVVAAIGARACRRYFLSAEPFDAATAQRLGLVQEVVSEDGLAVARDRVLAALLRGGPEALAAAKALIGIVAVPPPGLDLRRETARLIAERRASAEGREGVQAFLDKRNPAWVET